MSITEILFLILVILTLYSFFIFQVVLYVIGKLFGSDVKSSESNLPFVTLVISAYNEEKVIASKILNSLELNYPRDLLEIIVVSDSSTDNTDTIVKEYEQQGVILYRSSVRQGKTAGLNMAIDKTRGEIVVFTDADSMFDKNAVFEMAKLYSDPRVGSVTGSTNYISHQNGEMVATSSIYTKLERLTKKLESKIGSCVGADGAIFSIRKTLYRQLMNDDINDLVIPLNVVMQGYRVIYSDKVFCTEEPSSSSSNAFSRQARITNRTLRALFRRIHLLNPFKYPLFSFEILSHKFIRLSVPFYLLLLLPINLLLVEKSLVYQLCLFGQIMIYFAVLAGYLQNKRGQTNGLLLVAYHFMMVQAAIFKGWVDFLSGVNRITWSPRS